VQTQSRPSPMCLRRLVRSNPIIGMAMIQQVPHAMANSIAMHRLLLVLCFVSMVSCSKAPNQYESYSDAAKAGVVDRGWIPRFVPEGATDIFETHSVEANSSRIEFNYPEDTVPWWSEYSALPAADVSKARSILDLPRWSIIELDGDARYFEVCNEGGKGVLVVSTVQRRAHYREPVMIGLLNCELR
jgi:hypothetical protein